MRQGQGRADGLRRMPGRGEEGPQVREDSSPSKEKSNIQASTGMRTSASTSPTSSRARRALPVHRRQAGRRQLQGDVLAIRWSFRLTCGSALFTLRPRTSHKSCMPMSIGCTLPPSGKERRGRTSPPRPRRPPGRAPAPRGTPGVDGAKEGVREWLRRCTPGSSPDMPMSAYRAEYHRLSTGSLYASRSGCGRVSNSAALRWIGNVEERLAKSAAPALAGAWPESLLQREGMASSSSRPLQEDVPSGMVIRIVEAQPAGAHDARPGPGRRSPLGHDHQVAEDHRESLPAADLGLFEREGAFREQHIAPSGLAAAIVDRAPSARSGSPLL